MKSIFKILFILSLYSSTCLAGEKIILEYQAYTGGLNGLELTIEIDIDENNNYAINSVAETKGLIGFFYPSRSVFKTLGRIAQDRLLVKNYKAVKTVRKKERINLITYDNNGTPLQKHYTKNKRTTITDMSNFVDLARNATDYQSILLALFYNLENNNKCDSTLSIFNGKDRKTLIFSDNGETFLPKDNYTIFSGTAKECLMVVDEKTLEDEDIAWLFKDEGDTTQKPMKLWFSDSYKTPFPVLVGAELGSLGYGKIYLFISDIKVKREV